MANFDQEILKTVQNLHSRISSTPPKPLKNSPWSPSQIASKVDHTCLRPTASKKDILKTAQESLENHCFAVCVASSWVPLVKEYFKGNPKAPGIAAVAGFPHGNSSTETKRQEAQSAVAAGATEIDVVLNLGRLKEGDYTFVFEEWTQLRMLLSGTTLKAIVETAALNDLEKSISLWLCWKSGFDFIKTSTGFYVADSSYGPLSKTDTVNSPTTTGATVADIQRWRQWIDFFNQDPLLLNQRPTATPLQIKASGGIRKLDQARDLLNAGADRLGASQTAQWMLEQSNA